MEHRQITVTAQAIAELRTLVEIHRNLGVEGFIKPFSEFTDLAA